MSEEFAVYNQALEYYQGGKHQEALQLCEQLAERGWERPEPYFLAGLICKDHGKPEAALLYFHQAQFLAPDNTDYLLNLGVAYHSAGRRMLAKACYEKILSLAPGHPDACNNTGKLFMDAGDWENALEWFKKTVASNPGYYQAYFNTGVVLQDLGQLQGAAQAYTKCLDCFPGYHFASNNLGIVYQRLGALQKAAAIFEDLLAAHPEYTDAWNNLGTIYQDLGKLEDSIACYAKVVDKRADVPDILANLVNQLQYACDWKTFSLYYQRLKDQTLAALDSSRKPGITPFSAMKFQDDPELNLKISLFHARGLEARGKEQRFFPIGATGIRPGRKRLKLGYVSDDFQDHAMGHILSPLFEHHDRNLFEVVAYSHGRAKPGDPYRERIVSGCDGFKDITDLGIYESARMINEDEIDILVDLKGYTRFSRLGIFALRPAPVQVAYLGFLGTTGADFMDYLIADPVVIPEAEARHYTEKIVYLPCYQVTSYSSLSDNRKPGQNSALDPDAKKKARKEAGLPEAGTVMCSFNQPYKFTPQIFDVWMRVMRQVPESVLWLRKTSDIARTNLVRAAEEQGIGGNRLIFAPDTGLSKHLVRLELADLALDTPVYNGGATTSNALWAGVPVVTCPGRQLVARMSASSLYAMGMGELVADSLEAYEGVCVRIARDKVYREGLKARLKAARASSVLFDVPGFVRQLESAFRQIWDTQAGGS